MNRERFLFVRPPRPLWPFNGPASAFWPPLAFASLAASLRSALPDLDVQILDAPALHMGWRSLEAELERARPTYVGMGEEAVSCVEGLRLAGIAKRLGARVLAGGCFFAHVAPEVLATGLVDVVVHGEGEGTIVELVEAMRSPSADDLRGVAGISFAADGQAVFTGPRQPLDDLDRLPMPAWDLLPMDRYGRASRNHPHLAAVELGRGCPWACDFCVLWRQMGRFLDGRPAPLLRTKSAARVLEEVRTLARRYGRRYLGWVDPCFNADPDVPGQVAELLLRDGLRLGQSAWVRADGLLRDESSGALPQCVQAGLNEVYLGIERPDADGLRYLNKSHNGGEVRRAVRMLQEKHPEVFTVGSMIFGLPGDTPATIRGLYRFAHELDLDMVFYIPLTPLPGTPYWRPELWDPTGRFFRSCDFLPGVQGDPLIAELSRTLCWCFLLRWPWARLRWGLRGLTARDARRRSIIRRHSVRGLAFAFRAIAGGLLHRENADNMRYPAWYDT